MTRLSHQINPNDKQGRSYRAINLATPHAYPVGSLVEIDDGVRLYVAKHTRGVDKEPTYSLGWSKYHRAGDFVKEDFTEYGMAFVGIDRHLQELLN